MVWYALGVDRGCPRGREEHYKSPGLAEKLNGAYTKSWAGTGPVSVIYLKCLWGHIWGYYPELWDCRLVLYIYSVFLKGPPFPLMLMIKPKAS